MSAISRHLLGYLMAGLLLFTTHAWAGPGSYTVSMSGSDPTSYDRLLPAQLPCPDGGSASNPLPDASFGTGAQSLSPQSLALGQVVAFQLRVKVNGSTSPENGTIKVVPGFDTKTTSNRDFGFDPSYGVYCAFVDTSDQDNVALDGNESVSVGASSLVGDEIRGEITVSGLDNGDTVVVEIWAVLKDSVPQNANGNVQARLVSVETGAGQTINAGSQTIPSVKQIQEFTSIKADVIVQKSDAPDPVELYQTVQYILEVTNNSSSVVANDVTLVDTLDPETVFSSLSIEDNEGAETTCQHLAGVVSCDLGFLNFMETVRITLNVTVADTFDLADLDAVSAGEGPCDGSESLCNNASISVLNDGDPSNNSVSQPTNVKPPPGPLAMIEIDKKPNADAVYSGTNVLYRYGVSNSGTGAARDVDLTDDKCSPVIFDAFEAGDTDDLLEPGETWEYVCETPLLVTTMNIGKVSAVDVVTGIGLSAQNSANVTVIAPEMSLTKSASATSVDPGEVVVYTYDATNTGNDPISALAVSDDKCSPVVFSEVVSGNIDSLLDPGETWRFACSVALTEDTTNTATAEGRDSLQNPVVSNQAQAFVALNAPTPTPTPTSTPASTATATATSTPTPTPTATASPTGTPTATPTFTGTSVPTATPTSTFTPTATPTGQVGANATATPVPTPPVCTEADIRDLLVALDGQSHVQKQVVESAVRQLRKAAGRRPSSKKLAEAVLLEASRLMTESWSAVWSLPTSVRSCEASPLCVSVDLRVTVGGYAANAARFDELVQVIVKESRRIGTRKNALVRLSKKSKAALARALALSKDVPEANSVCGI